jgi:hypothetical protein
MFNASLLSDYLVLETVPLYADRISILNLESLEFRRLYADLLCMVL